MNMVHDMDKEVYKVCSCPRIKSYMHCTHIRKGMWVVGSEAISYFLREHPRTNQLLFDLFLGPRGPLVEPSILHPSTRDNFS